MREENYLSYNDFCKKIKDDTINKVTFDGNKVLFKIDENGKMMETTNPESDTFKEFLLKNDVIINEKVDPIDTIASIFEFCFFIIFMLCIYILYSRTFGKEKFKIIRSNKVKFDNVVGLESLKKDLRQVIEIMKNEKEYEKKGIRMPKGIILEGHPGNGKTLFAKALAGEANVNFIPTKATDFESAIMSIGPSKIKALFKLAKKNAPCIIFIDEFDGIGTKRNYCGSAVETENTRIVTALLNELDGFEKTSGVLVVVATNNAKVLDEALIRPGRFDRKYLIPCPGFEDRVHLIEYYLKDKEYDKNIDVKELATKCEGVPAAQIETIINEAAIMRESFGEKQINKICIDKAYEMVTNNIMIYNETAKNVVVK